MPSGLFLSSHAQSPQDNTEKYSWNVKRHKVQNILIFGVSFAQEVMCLPPPDNSRDEWESVCVYIKKKYK